MSLDQRQYWQKINALFDQLAPLDAATQKAEIEKITRLYPEYEADLISLLKAHQDAGTFLEDPIELGTLNVFAELSGDAQKARALAPGESVGDFFIESILGQGAFATVYRAEQKSLGRTVAIKVSRHSGREARDMAQLEHDHIVQVFSESSVPAENMHIVCMQFIDGPSLAQLIAALKQLPFSGRNGSAILDMIDVSIWGQTPFNAAAAKDRARLSQMPFEEACLWICARLAEALDFAHSLGLLHLDVKPANIMLNQYGRPLLADFNVAKSSRSPTAEVSQLIGGTLSYMSPEQRGLFEHKPSVALDGRSDIYSLGIVLCELLRLELPEPSTPQEELYQKVCEAGDLPDEILDVIHKMVAPRPEDRFASGKDCAEALDHARQIFRIRTSAEKDSTANKFFAKFPIATLILAAILPQCFGSLINILYNMTRITSQLTAAQQYVFTNTLLPYNLVTYGLGILIVVKQVTFVVTNIKKRQFRYQPDPVGMAALRRRALASARYLFVACSIGWLPGAVVFPWIIDLKAGPISGEVYWHFGVSFVTSWLVSMTYSYFFVESLILTKLYPKFWTGCCNISVIASNELRAVRRRMKVFQVMAGMIPLLGALMIVGTSSSVIDPDHYRVFQFLVTGLMAMAMFGFLFAVKMGNQISDTVRRYCSNTTS